MTDVLGLQSSLILAATTAVALFQEKSPGGGDLVFMGNLVCKCLADASVLVMLVKGVPY